MSIEKREGGGYTVHTPLWRDGARISVGCRLKQVAQFLLRESQEYQCRMLAALEAEIVPPLAIENGVEAGPLVYGWLRKAAAADSTRRPYDRKRYCTPVLNRRDFQNNKQQVLIPTVRLHLRMEIARIEQHLKDFPDDRHLQSMQDQLYRLDWLASLMSDGVTQVSGIQVCVSALPAPDGKSHTPYAWHLHDGLSTNADRPYCYKLTPLTKLNSDHRWEVTASAKQQQFLDQQDAEAVWEVLAK